VIVHARSSVPFAGPSTTVPGASTPRNSAYDLFAQLMQRQGGQGQSAPATAGSSMSMSV